MPDDQFVTNELLLWPFHMLATFVSPNVSQNKNTHFFLFWSLPILLQNLTCLINEPGIEEDSTHERSCQIQQPQCTYSLFTFLLPSLKDVCYTLKARVTDIKLNKCHRKVTFISRDCPDFNASDKLLKRVAAVALKA